MIHYTHKFFYTLVLLVLLIFSPLTSKSGTHKTPLMLGSMQFPHTVHSLPVPCVYWMGKKIPCEVHEATKRVTFDFPKGNHIKDFFVLVTESIGYKLKKHKGQDQQTIDYINVMANQEYKLYKLSLTTQTDEHEQLSYCWDIKQLSLDITRRIPDATIIVLSNPDYVENLEGGNELTLPTIQMKTDMIERAGSEQQLQEDAILLQLASIDSDTLHAPLKHVVKHIGHRTLVAPA